MKKLASYNHHIITSTNHLIILFSFSFLLFTSCNAPKKQEVTQTDMTIRTDSLFVPTGNAELDSLLQLAAVAPVDTNLAKLYYNIGDIFHEFDFDKAKKFYLKMGDLSKQLNWGQGHYLANNGFALILLREGLSDSAIVINQQTLEWARNKKNDLWIGGTLHNLGMAYSSKGWLEMAWSCYYEALEIYERMNLKGAIQTIYVQMTNLYSNIGNFEKAIEFGEKSLALDNEDPYILLALHKAYGVADQNEKAKHYLLEALRICEMQNNMYMLGTACYYASGQALEDFDLKKAEEFIDKSLKINSEIENWGIYYGTLISKSKLEELKGNFAQAEKYILEVLEIALEEEDLEVSQMCYHILSELALAQGKFRQNMDYFNKVYITGDKITNESAIRSAAEMDAKYETAKKEFEIENQKQIIKRQNLQRNYFIAGIAVLVVVLALLWFLFRLRTRQKRLLAETNAMKDKFFSIISHDLKNPAIMQKDAIKLLVKNGASWDAETIQNYYNELLKSAEGQVELLYNLLNWAQMETGRMPFTPTTFDLLPCLQPDITLVQEMAKNKGITFSLQMPDETPITADRNMIATIVRNLLTNAVKFTPTGGTVTLEITPTTNLSPQTPLRISVFDTGIGMTEEQIRKLSDKLYGKKGGSRVAMNRVSTHGTANEAGTGLGLIVCKELLEKHGSVLHIESEIGKGSTFWFELYNQQK